MRQTTFHKLAIVWLALWFGVIVPGHKRGLVLLPGGERPTTSQSTSGEPCPLAKIMGTNGSCCPGAAPARSPSPTAPGMPVSHCAICYIVGVLDVPPPPDFAPKPQELIAILPWPAPVEVDSASNPQTYLGRAPPIV